MQRLFFNDRVAVVLAAIFLLGATINRAYYAPPEDPGPYLARVRQVAKKMPIVVGDWQAVDLPDGGTADYLRANVFISRSFTNSATGQQLTLLIDECGDARDLTPHYPPICYPGRGLHEAESRTKDWQISDMTVMGREYRFEATTFNQEHSCIVENFMVLPTGGFCRDMKEVKAVLPIRDRYFGLGQVQVVFSDGTPEEVRETAFREIMGAYRELIQAMRNGVRS